MLKVLFLAPRVPKLALHQERDYVMPMYGLRIDPSLARSAPAAFSPSKMPFFLSCTSQPSLVSGWLDSESSFFAYIFYKSLLFLVFFALAAKSLLNAAAKVCKGPFF
jgi:hypothetical protein